MKEYTVSDFCIKFEILFYESDVMPFAYSEGWFTHLDILDSEGNVIDDVIILDQDAINDTLKRLHMDITIETTGHYIIA
jgi:hypothetical protein